MEFAVEELGLSEKLAIIPAHQISHKHIILTPLFVKEATQFPLNLLNIYLIIVNKYLINY